MIGFWSLRQREILWLELACSSREQFNAFVIFCSCHILCRTPNLSIPNLYPIFKHSLESAEEEVLLLDANKAEQSGWDQLNRYRQVLI